MDLTLEEVLQGFQGFQRIERDEPYSLPKVPSDLWDKKIQPIQARNLQSLAEYVNMPYFIVDPTLLTDENRGAWRRALAEKFPEAERYYVANNCLATNMTASIRNIAYLLRCDYKGTDANGFSGHLEALDHAANTYDAGYRQMPNEDKMAFVRTLKSEIKSLLSFLSVQQPL